MTGKRRSEREEIPDVVRDALGKMVCQHGEPRGSAACPLCRLAARAALGEDVPQRRYYHRPASTPMPDYLVKMLANLKAGRRPDPVPQQPELW